MAKQKKVKRADRGRRSLLRGMSMAPLWLLIGRLADVGGLWSLGKELWPRATPAPTVLTPAPVTIALTPQTGRVMLDGCVTMMRVESSCAR